MQQCPTSWLERHWPQSRLVGKNSYQSLTWHFSTSQDEPTPLQMPWTTKLNSWHWHNKDNKVHLATPSPGGTQDKSPSQSVIAISREHQDIDFGPRTGSYTPNGEDCMLHGPGSLGENWCESVMTFYGQAIRDGTEPSRCQRGGISGHRYMATWWNMSRCAPYANRTRSRKIDPLGCLNRCQYI